MTINVKDGNTRKLYDLVVGNWTDRDGRSYRAVYIRDDVGSTVLTGPEHAGLPDDELLLEGLAEAKRAEILV